MLLKAELKRHKVIQGMCISLLIVVKVNPTKRKRRRRPHSRNLRLTEQTNKSGFKVLGFPLQKVTENDQNNFKLEKIMEETILPEISILFFY